MVTIDNKKYKVIKDYKNGLNLSDLEDKITDYYESFDYILGDYAYGKVRLKGFNDKSNPNFKEVNDYSKIEEYIENYCAYDCKYFILQKIIEKE